MGKIAKNAPCPCGSQKKYKHCCEAKDLKRKRKMQTRLGGLIAVLLLLGIGMAALIGFQKVHKETATLDQLAQCLSKKGWKMYGAWWCPHCKDQKEMFGKAFQYIKYIECSEKDRRKQTPICRKKGVRSYPTWEDPQGELYPSARYPEELANLSGCPYAAVE